MTYNPFNKELDQLTESDLHELISGEIVEGWYIEYKAEIPRASGGSFDSNKIAKSVAAFANTKGGWIFWGIGCNDKNKPVSIAGIEIQTPVNFEDQIAKIINSNINPKPYYHFKRLDLQNGRAVVVIQVEESPTPPYITSQGVIYQREYNENKPVRDRYILEKLNEKTSEYRDAIERYSQLHLPETKGQAEWNQTHLELYLFPLPFNGFHFKEFYSSEFFKKAANRFYQGINLVYKTSDEQSLEIPLSLNFNSIFSSERSIIVRPLSEANLIYKSTTVELFDNGNLKFLIPLTEFDSTSIPKRFINSATVQYLLDKFSPNENVRADTWPMMRSGASNPIMITRRKQTDFVNHVKFIDGMNLIFVVLIMTSIYKSVLEDNNFDFTTEIGFRAKITDCWRKFVFFDEEDYLEKIKLYNIPLSPKNDIEIPAFRKGNAYSVNLSDQNAFLLIAKFILEGIGLPDIHSMKFEEILKRGIESFKSTD